MCAWTYLHGTVFDVCMCTISEIPLLTYVILVLLSISEIEAILKGLASGKSNTCVEPKQSAPVTFAWSTSLLGGSLWE